MEKKKQHNFIISMAGESMDISVWNIEEATKYTEKHKKRAVLLSEKKTYQDLDSVDYVVIFNATKPILRRVNAKDKPYSNVFPIVVDKFCNGLLIAESDIISQTNIEDLCKIDLEERDMDIMVCHNHYSDLTQCEIQAASFIKVYANPEITQEDFMFIQKAFGEKAISIIIAQGLANHISSQSEDHFAAQKDVYEKEGMDNVINYYEYAKQKAFFVYIDLKANKIFNIDKAIVEDFCMNNFEDFGLPKEQMKMILDLIT